VLPVSTTPPNPAGFHAVFGISNNVPFNPGTAQQIDVSGDTSIGVANMGVNPTHAAILPNNSRVFVASAGSLFPGDTDVVMAFTPAADSPSATGLGAPVTFTLPAGSLPIFVHTAQNNTVFVANYGTNSVSAMSTATNLVTMTGASGLSPVALSETPDGLNLYVVNQGDNTVSDLSPVDLSTLATIPVGNTPVWAVSRPDSRRVYVVTKGDGQLYSIDTAKNAQIPGSPQPVGGAGANFVLYDSINSRLYVTNPAASAVFVFDATTDPPTPLVPTGSASNRITIPSPPPCATNGVTCTPVAPVSVAALADGSRFYVASSVTATPCPDSNVGNGGASNSCLIPQLTVFNARSLTLKPISASLLAPSLSLLSAPQFAASQYAVPLNSTCAPAATYGPSSTRFRMFTTAAADSSHVYVSLCDAGTIADINATTSSIATGGTNTPDLLAADITTPLGTCAGAACPQVANITAFSIASNVVTFQAVNNFFAGELVSISGLSSNAGTNFDGLTLTVLATGLSGTQFECTLSVSQSDASLTTDTGTAVPLPRAQSPIFLLAGQ